MERHDSLLPHGLLGVREKIDDLGQHGRDGLLADKPARGGERGADDEVVVGPEVLLDGVYDEDDEVVALVDEERDGEVPRALEREGLVVGHLDGVDVAEGGVVAEHLGVDEAEEELLHLAAGHVRVGEAALEVLELAGDDAVQELLRLPPPALRPHRQLPPDRPELLHWRSAGGSEWMMAGWSPPATATAAAEASGWGRGSEEAEKIGRAHV